MQEPWPEPERVRLMSEGGPPLEIERRYLLVGRPELPEPQSVLELEQGWLPGDGVRVRLRRVREGDDERYVRTRKLGSGLSRIEYEESLSKDVFERLWPGTQGCRVRKRRHRIPSGALTWEIDEYHDHALFVAEVELPSEDTVAPIPTWLSPYVEREVTLDPRYTSLQLALRGVPDRSSDDQTSGAE